MCISTKAAGLLMLIIYFLWPPFPVSSSSVDLLEKLCIEGTRKQVKYAVKALAAINGDSGLKIFSTLYRVGACL
jgi:hypothetical protein